MRLLVLADAFTIDGASPWLVEDLAGALVRQGHLVDVVANDRTVPRPLGAQGAHPSGARIFSVGCTTAPRSTWHRRSRLIPSLLAYRSRTMRMIEQQRYAGVVFSSLAFTKMRLAQALVERGIAERCLLIHWDFFPRHHAEIGGRLAPQRLLGAPLYRLERWAVSGADAVAVMSQMNQEFFHRYFRTDPPIVVVQPPWGVDLSRPVVASRSEPPGRTVAVFGGQLTAGRGLDDIIRAAEILERQGDQIEIRVYGDGPARARLVATVADLALTNLRFMGRIPRERYATSLSEAHCGIAATVPNVSVPTFPSKIVDYAGAAVPVVAASEASSDVGDIVVARGAGWACPAGDPAGLARSLEAVHRSRLDGTWAGFSAAARRWFDNELSAEAAARTVAGALRVPATTVEHTA